mmetsp:Transcript_26546/g.61775  ORF Transcript_26546/g.61775 Transcript_26546/m.61775 type:complete len:89 (-) Transcript_26546:845-1111(-)
MGELLESHIPKSIAQTLITKGRTAVRDGTGRISTLAGRGKSQLLDTMPTYSMVAIGTFKAHKLFEAVITQSSVFVAYLKEAISGVSLL